jgi:CDGSH-type Zn-finger protein
MDALINVIVLVYTIGILPLQASLEGSGMDFVLIVIAVFYILQIHDLKVPKAFSWPRSTSLLSETARVTAKRKLEGKFQEMINEIIKMALVSKKRNRAFFACTFIKEEFNQFHRVLLQETMTTLSEAGQDYKKLEKQNASDEAITAKLDEIELIERLISALNESHGNLSEKLASFEDHVSINLRRSDSAQEDFDDHESIIRQSDSAEEFGRGLRQLNSAEEFERGLRQLCWCSRSQNIHYCDACHSLPPDQIAFGARHV